MEVIIKRLWGPEFSSLKDITGITMITAKLFQAILLFLCIAENTIGADLITLKPEEEVKGNILAVRYVLPKAILAIDVPIKRLAYTPGAFTSKVDGAHAQAWLANSGLPSAEAISCDIKPGTRAELFVFEAPTLWTNLVPDETHTYFAVVPSSRNAATVAVSYAEKLRVSAEVEGAEAASSLTMKPVADQDTYAISERLSLLLAPDAASSLTVAQAANRLRVLRDRREKLLAAQTQGLSDEQLQEFLRSTDREIRMLTSEFTGTTQSNSSVLRLRIDPSHLHGYETLSPIATLDTCTGEIALGANVATSSQVVTSKGTPMSPSVLSIALTELMSPAEKTLSRPPERNPAHGLRHRVPATGRVTITLDRNEMISRVVMIPQLGRVEELLPGESLDPKGNLLYELGVDGSLRAVNSK